MAKKKQHESFEPTATAWAFAFYCTLTSQGWFKHPIHGKRIPHVTEFTERWTYIFGLPVSFVQFKV